MDALLTGGDRPSDTAFLGSAPPNPRLRLTRLCSPLNAVSLDAPEHGGFMDTRPQRPIQLLVSVARPQHAPEASGHGFLDILKALAAFISGVAWPLVVVTSLLVFRQPVHSLVAALADRVHAATKFSAGAISFEIQRIAEANGNPELGSLVSGLSAAAVERLLTTGNASHGIVGTWDTPTANLYSLPKEREMTTLRDLERKGLLKFSQPFEEWMARFNALLEPDSSVSGERVPYRAKRALNAEELKWLHSQSVSLTPLGRRALDLVVQTIVGSIERSK
jgi:hypothetical protein